MKNYILHIGLPKTGTTAIQKHYFSKLQDPSICYNPYSINRPLVEAIKLLEFDLLKKEDIELLHNIIMLESSKIQQNNILISNELLSQRLMKFDFMERGNFLNSVFPNATVVLILRYQPIILRSLYQQQIFQNYLIQPEEVFVPFAKRQFSKSEYWKSSMQIDVKQWDYKETIKHFNNYYGNKFCVLFYENYSEDIIEIGRNVLEFAGFHVDRGKLNYSLPKANVSYDAGMMGIMLRIARYKWALNSYAGFDSPRVQNLMEQAKRARYLFDSEDVKDFLIRMESKQYTPRTTYSFFDRQLLKAIKRYSRLRSLYIEPKRYELPEPIKSYLEHESKLLNASLIELIDKRQIPEQYL